MTIAAIETKPRRRWMDRRQKPERTFDNTALARIEDTLSDVQRAGLVAMMTTLRKMRGKSRASSIAGIGLPQTNTTRTLNAFENHYQRVYDLIWPQLREHERRVLGWIVENDDPRRSPNFSEAGAEWSHYKEHRLAGAACISRIQALGETWFELHRRIRAS